MYKMGLLFMVHDYSENRQCQNVFHYMSSNAIEDVCDGVRNFELKDTK